MRHLGEQDLEALFDAEGYFYNKDGFQFRKFLDIKRRCDTTNKDVPIEKNDLSVVMMNPGSSRPRDVDENTCTDYLDKFVEAHPDATQYQIMRVMENCGYNYAKIVNLSDIRCADSDDFFRMLANELVNIDHSIFSEANRHHLKTNLNSQSLFILAWGVDIKLRGLAQQALGVLNSTDFWGESLKKIGIPHTKEVYAYYHPLPPNYNEQVEWVKKITAKIVGGTLME